MAPAPAWSSGMASGRASPAPRAGSSLVPQRGYLGVRPHQAEPGLPVPECLGLGNLPPWHKELLSIGAGEDCPKQCPSP